MQSTSTPQKQKDNFVFISYYCVLQSKSCRAAPELLAEIGALFVSPY